VINPIRWNLVSLAYAAIANGVRLPRSKMVADFNQWCYLIDLIRLLEINVFLDVGANRGFFSKRLRMWGYRGHLFSFEPITEDHERISALAANDSNWTVCGYALGAESGSTNFNINSVGDNQTVLSSFLPFKAQLNSTRTVPVKVRRLDEVLPELIAGIGLPRIFLKMDTQGFDGQVLDGASSLRKNLEVEPLFCIS
jgi:FkbM family methyltransferase